MTPPENIHDSQKVVILPLHKRSKVYDRKCEAIKRILSKTWAVKRIDSTKNSIAESDKDLQLMLAKDKQLISYTYEE